MQLDNSNTQINIHNLIFQRLLFELIQQYQSSNFEVNACLKHAVQGTFEYKQQLKIDISQEEVKEIRSELTMFVFAFTQAPSVWANLLTNDQISSKSTKIIINQSETITKVYKQIIKQTNSLIDEHKKLRKINQAGQSNFQKLYMNQATKTMLVNLLNSVANQICLFYEQGKSIIHTQQNKVEELIKSSQIINPYYLFGMLKQMSSYTYRKIQEAMSEYFKCLPAQAIKSFCKYVQKNFESVKLMCSDQDNKIYTDEEFEKHVQEQNKYWLDYIEKLDDNHLTLKRIRSIRGDDAIMIVQKVQDEEEFEEAEKLIFKIGQGNIIQVTNCKASQKKWAIFDMKDSVSNLYRLIKHQIQEQKYQKPFIAYGIPINQYANFGRNVGKCLASINKYKSANQFLMDLSKNTIIGGSITYVLTQVPILRYFIIASGLTYTFYNTFSNKATSALKKANQIYKTSIGAVGAVGSTVACMMLGQTFIPIPFLGAFVGGVIGGFLGAAGTKQILQLLNKESFNNLANFLLESAIGQSHWIYSLKLLQQLGINDEYFLQQICPKQSQRDSYITAICFCIASFHQAKRYAKRNEQKMKELQQHQKETEQQQQAFENEFNIVAIVNYLTQNRIVLLLEHEKLQNCIKHYII